MINIIYILKNKINTKVYIGQTWQTLKERGDSGHGYKGCVYLERAIKKYGWKDNFYYEELFRCYTQDQADEQEIYFINLYDSRNREKGYNLREGGSKGKNSEESKQKMRKPKSEEAKKNMSGRVFSEETKQKISSKLIGNQNSKGMVHSKETKQKMRKTHDGHFKKGQIPHNKGTKGICKPTSGSFSSDKPAPNKGRKRIIDKNGKIKYIKVSS